MAYESFPVFREPQCLIESDKDGKLMVVEDVLNQISQIPMQLNVVAIIGTYRTGKSFLLNRLAKVNNGFPLGSTIQSKTKGIWVWCRPHPVRSTEVLLLLDTEGLGDVEKGNTNHDYWIFTLATLLASTLVYNAMGYLDNDALEKWSFVAEMSERVKICDNPSSETETADNLDLYLPLFIVTLRDFCLDLEIVGRQVTSDEYLEYCLNLRKGESDSDVKYNTPRMCIRKYFRKRKCFTFDRPCARSNFKKLEDVPDQDLYKEFVEDSETFTSYIFSECRPKFLPNGQPVNGRMFASMTRAYVNKIRDGKIPCIKSDLDMMAQDENTKAVEACVQMYLNEMKSRLKLPVPHDKDLSETHHVCFKAAINLFMENAIDLFDQREKYLREATDQINVVYEEFKSGNEKESEDKSIEALQELFKPIETKIKEKVYTVAGGYDLYQKDIDTIKDKYKQMDGLGSKKEETLLSYLKSKLCQGQTILQADEKLQEKEREAEIEKQKAITAEMEKKEVESRLNIQIQKTEDEARQNEESKRQLNGKHEKEKDHLKEHYDEMLRCRKIEHERLLQEGLDEAAKCLFAISLFIDSGVRAYRVMKSFKKP